MRRAGVGAGRRWHWRGGLYPLLRLLKRRGIGGRGSIEKWRGWYRSILKCSLFFLLDLFFKVPFLFLGNFFIKQGELGDYIYINWELGGYIYTHIY
jgi:hypothetical protein